MSDGWVRISGDGDELELVAVRGSSLRHCCRCLRMKKSRRLSLPWTLQRVRLGVTLSLKKWWTSSRDRRCQVQLAGEPAAADDDVELLEDSAKLDNVGSSRSLSLICNDRLQEPRSSSLPPSKALPVTLKVLFGSPLTVLSRFKKSCGTLHETAKRSGFHVDELFVGNQAFMLFSAIPMTRPRKIQARPSKGFADRKCTEAQNP